MTAYDHSSGYTYGTDAVPCARASGIRRGWTTST